MPTSRPSSANRASQRTAAASNFGEPVDAYRATSDRASMRLMRPSSRAAVSASRTLRRETARWNRPCGEPCDVTNTCSHDHQDSWPLDWGKAFYFVRSRPMTNRPERPASRARCLDWLA